MWSPVHGEGEQRGGQVQAGPQRQQRDLQGHHRQERGQRANAVGQQAICS